MTARTAPTTRTARARRAVLRSTAVAAGTVAALAVVAAPASADGRTSSNGNGAAYASCNGYGNVDVWIDPSAFAPYVRYTASWKYSSGATITTASDTDWHWSSGLNSFSRKYGPNYASYVVVTPQWESSWGGWNSIPSITVACR